MKYRKFLAAIFAFITVVSDDALGLTAVDRYVNTDCSNNGDGTASSCAASPGAAGAYLTLQQAITDIVADNADFVSADIAVTVHCEGAAADSGGDTGNAAADITGLTLDATRNLTITVDSGKRHDGKWNTGKYRISGGYYNGLLRIRENFVTVSWLQLENSKTSAGGGTPGSGLFLEIGGVTTGKLVFAQNIIRYSGDYTNQTAKGVDDQQNETSGVTKIWRNNIFYDWKGTDFRAQATSNVVRAYNNTVYTNASSSTCLTLRATGTSSTLVAKNNIVNGTCTGYDIDASGSGATWTHNNNLSEDTTSPDDTYDSLAVSFENEGSDDYHLASGDTAAKDAGADVSGDTDAMSIDIDDQTRSGSWDIGADEYQAGGSSAAPFVTLKEMGIL